MLISPRHLVDRIRYPKSRADELARLRARFAAAPNPRQAGPEQRAAAVTMKALRAELAAVTGSVVSCHSCAKGHPLPEGRWAGGHCCGGQTLRLFSEDEVASLKLVGISAKNMDVPSDDHAGCIFRGPKGCSLAAEQRPNICLRYICNDLRAELRATPRWREISRLAADLGKAFDSFSAMRASDSSSEVW